MARLASGTVGRRVGCWWWCVEAGGGPPWSAGGAAEVGAAPPPAAAAGSWEAGLTPAAAELGCKITRSVEVTICDFRFHCALTCACHSRAVPE